MTFLKEGFKYLIGVALLLMFCRLADAQYSEKDFAVFSMSQGLTDNFVTSITQDNTGAVWIGTDVGLNRFEGNVFKRYMAGNKDVPFKHDLITRVKNIGNNQIAIITRNGTMLLNTQTYQSLQLRVPDSTAFQMRVNDGWDALRMTDGNIALTTRTGFYVFTTAGKIIYRYDHFTEKDRKTKRILFGRNMYPLYNGEVVIKCFTDSLGLAVYNIQKRKLRIINRNDKTYAPLFAPPQLSEDRWIGTLDIGNNTFLQLPNNIERNITLHDFKTGQTVLSPLPFEPVSTLGWRSAITKLNDTTFALSIGDIKKGFYIFNLNPLTKKITFNPTHFLPAYTINSMFVDKEKRLWVGTDKGVLMQKLKKPWIKTFSFDFKAEDSLVQMISCALRMKNKLLIGYSNKRKGLLVVDTATMKPLKQMGFYGNNNMYSQLNSIKQINGDTVWIGTQNGLLWLDCNTYRYGKVLPEIFDKKDIGVYPIDSRNNIWVVDMLDGHVSSYNRNRQAWKHYTAKTDPALPFPKVKQVVQDSYGDTWISGHALTRLVTATQKFDTTIISYAGPQKYEDDIVAISADKIGNIWMHNAYNGLLQYNIKEKKYTAYSTDDGLPSNSIESLSPVIDGKLWFRTARALGNIDVQTKKITVLDTEDGFMRLPTFTKSMYFDNETLQLYYFNDNSISWVEVLKPRHKNFFLGLYIRSLETNTGFEIFDISDSLTLSHKTKTINFQFGVVDFEEGRRYNYSYKIDNNNWIDLGSSTTLNLNGLDSGPFEITIRALGKDGVYHAKSIRIDIRYPFWERNWFYILIGMVASGLVFLLVRYRINRIKQKARIEKEIAQSEMKVLHAQMNPHFMFNSLNSIREMILNSENREASHYLSKFGQLLRLTLNQSVRTFVSLRETIEHLQRYIEMEQVRNDKFTTRILVGDELDVDEVFLPPMLIQPFIENSLWHGVSPQKKNIDIKIDFSIENGHLLCKIEDDGVGIEKSKLQKAEGVKVHKSVGLDNIQNRIKVLNEKYDIQCSLSIEDKASPEHVNETGTIVKIYLPLNINA